MRFGAPARSPAAKELSSFVHSGQHTRDTQVAGATHGVSLEQHAATTSRPPKLEMIVPKQMELLHFVFVFRLAF